MTQPQKTEKTRSSWHESLAAVLITLILAAVVTSPCWCYVLFQAVSK